LIGEACCANSSLVASPVRVRRLPLPGRDAAAARRFFVRALRTLTVTPCEVVTDAAPVYLAVLDELLG
jgi:hypothetical protein